MSHSNDLTPDLLAQCREQAKPHRGVKFDARIRKFITEIYDGQTKRQKWIGAYLTAAEAAEAYRKASESRPTLRPTLASTYRAWLQLCAKDADGHPLPGEVFVAPDQQAYEVAEVTRAVTPAGREVVWYHFTSNCRTCNAAFNARHVPGPSAGLNRNCDLHKRRPRFRHSGATGKKLHEPEDGSDLI